MTKSSGNPSVPTSPPLSSSLKDRGRGKKRKRNKRQGRNWNLQGWLWCCHGYNCEAETLNGSAVGCRTKNTSFSFIQLRPSNTHIINIYYRWPYHTDLIKDEDNTSMYRHNTEAVSVSACWVVLQYWCWELRVSCHTEARGQSLTRTSILTDWPTSTTLKWKSKFKMTGNERN